MSHELDRFLQESTRALESELSRWMPASSLDGSEDLNRAIRYALFPGGKRMRPLFTLLATHTAGGNWRDALPVACAVEYFHTCSLVLDDLPCMDGASERRGKRPTHLEFGESTAILAAVSLLNGSWGLLLRNDASPEGVARTRRLVEEAARCIGPDGIIGGQFLDLANRDGAGNAIPNLLKTASTTRFMLSSGAIVADAPDRVVETLADFGREIGSAYQMLDDVIDREADARSWAGAAAALPVDRACDCLNECMDALRRRIDDGRASLMLEYTPWIFQPVIDRARRCVRPEGAGIQSS